MVAAGSLGSLAPVVDVRSARAQKNKIKRVRWMLIVHLFSVGMMQLLSKRYWMSLMRNGELGGNLGFVLKLLQSSDQLQNYTTCVALQMN